MREYPRTITVRKILLFISSHLLLFNLTAALLLSSQQTTVSLAFQSTTIIKTTWQKPQQKQCYDTRVSFHQQQPCATISSRRRTTSYSKTSFVSSSTKLLQQSKNHETSVLKTRIVQGGTRSSSSSSLSSFALFSSTIDDDNDEKKERSSLTRRRFGILSSLGVLGSLFLNIRERTPSDYPFYNLLPVGPYKRKKTIFETIVPNQIWTGTQKFGILNVQVPLRMTIVKLSQGGLFVYDPIAPTKEVVNYVKSLETQYGPVKHIVLGSVAIEHKIYASIFAQKFSKIAQLWVQPGQYNYPINLPDTFVGFPSNTKLIPNRKDIPQEWKNDFKYDTLGPIISRDGAFGETVFYHKLTNTLLCTDTVVEVTDEVPSIYDDDPKPLLYHARDTVTDIVEDTSETRQKGWKRIVLFGLFFMPSAIKIKDADVAFKERRPDINPDFAGIYPWDWIDDGDIKSFNALKGGLLVAPILQKLLLNRQPVETLDFADRVSKWNIQRIIPAHLKNNLQYDSKAYRQAFSFLDASGIPNNGQPKPLDDDFQTLVDANESLLESGAVAKVPPLPGGKVSRADIIAQTAYNCRGNICSPKAPLNKDDAM